MWKPHVDYSREYYCSKCQEHIPKTEAERDVKGRLICPYCHSRIRDKPRRPKRNRKYIQPEKPRIDPTRYGITLEPVTPVTTLTPDKPQGATKYNILYYSEDQIRLYNTANTAILYGHKIVRRSETL